jgi:hypothetical protein
MGSTDDAPERPGGISITDKIKLSEVCFLVGLPLPAAETELHAPGGQPLEPRLKGKTMKLYVGQTAPDFRLPSQLGTSVSLSHFRGKNLVLAFFPLAWTPI